MFRFLNTAREPIDLITSAEVPGASRVERDPDAGSNYPGASASSSGSSGGGDGGGGDGGGCARAGPSPLARFLSIRPLRFHDTSLTSVAIHPL
jgi:hypothetical protein